MKTQFLVSVRFLSQKIISSVIRKKLPLFDLQIQYVRHFLNIYCDYKYTDKYADDNIADL